MIAQNRKCLCFKMETVVRPRETPNGGVQRAAFGNKSYEARSGGFAAMTCSPPPFTFTAAAVATLQLVNFIFTTPKFAFAQLSIQRRMAREVGRRSSSIFRGERGNESKFKFSSRNQQLQFPLCHLEAANG